MNRLYFNIDNNELLRVMVRPVSGKPHKQKTMVTLDPALKRWAIDNHLNLSKLLEEAIERVQRQKRRNKEEDSNNAVT